MEKQRIFTVQDARRERYDAEAHMELKARGRELRRLRGLRKIAAGHGWDAMVARYDSRIAKMEALI